MIELVNYRNKLKAAFLGRAAGCTLGAPVEGWTLSQIEDYAAKLGIEFPCNDYWPATPYSDDKRYIMQTFKDYTKPYLNAIPCDDDIGYTLLSLFIAEEGHGINFTLEDVKNAWLKYITECYTAERAALDNLLKGIPAEKAAEIDNPWDELIGADIRCDGYGYMSPGNPQLAAKMAETDAYISHRKNGIYGSRYFAAVISSAFVTNDVKASLYEGLKYIPDSCELAEGLRWALDIWDKVGDYKNAAALIDERYPDMHVVHTINNACLTVFGLALGGTDFGRVIGNCVAMAHDCDCTAATAGSIMGAAYGMDCLDEKWYAPFGDRVNSYFNGPDFYKISDILKRYEALALTSGMIAE
ncbi:MAG: ADP-ribosylglycohydrolase family protein [Eubacteriales bacterium]|nr:ADP-ribosylglycohydrolase family protein [Eubacteriales bacterium]